MPRTVDRIGGMFLLFVAPALLAGCATASIDDAVPAGAHASSGQPSGSSAAAPAFSTPGEYPNLNVIPTPAAAQITADEKRATTEELRAKRAAQAGQGGAAGDQSAELRRLARAHADDALKAIETSE